MFDFFRKKETGYIFATQTGKAVSVLEIPDEVFSEKILGDGAGVIPCESEVVSPVNGEVIQVADTKHAFCIRSDDGLDILIHVGINTVGLKGEGFETLVGNGQKVKVGDVLGKADLEFIKQNGYPIHTAVLITNMQDIEDMQFIPGETQAGKTQIISYKKK